jgi:hypothetical protein
MPDRLELELRELGRRLEFPAEPDVAARIGERLRGERAPRRPLLLPRRPLALAAALLVVALAAALAVPPVRGALLDLLGIGGVTIERVEELPPVAPSTELELGRRVTLAEARRRVDFRVLAPAEEEWGRPAGVFLAPTPPGGSVSLLYGAERRPRLLVTAFRGDTEPGLVNKAVDPETRIRPIRVRGNPGYFISGAPHAVVFRDADGNIREDEYRLARDVLLWVEDGVTYRLEGDFDLERALDVVVALR